MRSDLVSLVLGEVTVRQTGKKVGQRRPLHLLGQKLGRLPLPLLHQLRLLGLQEIRAPPHELERALEKVGHQLALPVGHGLGTR